MTQLDIVYTVIIVICLVITGGNGVIALVRYLKGKKYDDNEYKTRCKMLAGMLRAGVEVPTSFIIKVLEGRINNETFAESIKDFKKEDKKKK